MTLRRIGQSCAAMAICLAASASAQTQNGEWRSYGGDPGSMKYAPLDQINRTNVSNLRIAWRRPAVDRRAGHEPGHRNAQHRVRRHHPPALKPLDHLARRRLTRRLRHLSVSRTHRLCPVRHAHRMIGNTVVPE